MNNKQIAKVLLNVGCYLFSIVAYSQEGHPPPCTEVKQVTVATDSVKQKILFDFIQNCVKGPGFDSDYDKGIIHLYEYHTNQNQLCWCLFPRIDDIYKDNPPSRFSDFKGDIILVYDADSMGRVLKTVGNKAVLNQCLEQIIGDRVFTRPMIKTRWTSDVLPYINRKRNQGNRRNQLGSNGIIIRFNKDGTYEISHLG